MPETPAWLATLVVLASGVFALYKFWDQRNRELQQRRFEQYWKLIDASQESPYLAKQKIALLLLKKYPEFKAETVAFLRDLQARGGGIPEGWVAQNASTIDEVLEYFAT